MAVVNYLFLAAALVIAPTQGTTNTDGMVKEITVMNMLYKDALLAGDVDRMIAMYTPDVRIMPDGFPTMVGTEVLKSTLGWIANVGDMKYTIEELIPMCDDGQYFMERKTTIMTDKKGNIMMDGKSVIIWKMTEAGFRVYVDIYNDNGPLPKAVAK